jgi:hypothetical protein
MNSRVWSLQNVEGVIWMQVEGVKGTYHIVPERTKVFLNGVEIFGLEVQSSLMDWWTTAQAGQVPVS